MVAPELRWPITPTTPSSTSRCATVVAVLGSAPSSSLINSNTTGLPPSVGWSALISSIASRAPLSLSLPRWAWGPVSGEDWPILTICAPPDVASGFLPQAVNDRAATSATARVDHFTERLQEKSANGQILHHVGSAPLTAKTKPAQGRLGVRRAIALLAQNPRQNLVQVSILHLRICWHGNRTPHAFAASLHLGKQPGFCALVGLVFGRDFLERRADYLLVHTMAGH